MSEMSILPLRHQRLTWTIYCVFIALVAGIYFGSLSELMLEVDDERTFRDNVAVAQDFTLVHGFSLCTRATRGGYTAALFYFSPGSTSAVCRSWCWRWTTHLFRLS